jgi:DNA (cytosine-5)-methyltransferase 1
MSKMTGVSLFAGVGGFDLAMQRNGVDVVASVEIDKKCQEVLAKHFPSAKIFDDVTTVKGSDLIEAGFDPSNGIITGGFPCQDLSVAGKRAGLAGERSGLFWEIVRIAKETKAKYLILENVPGLLSSQNGRDFAIVLSALQDIGYVRLAWRVLDAQHFGVPQRRRRVFIVGCLGDEGATPSEVLAIVEGRAGYLEASQQKGKAVAREAADGVGVFSQSGFAKYTKGVMPLTATSYKRPEDTIVVDSFTPSSFAGYQEGVGTLRSNGGDLGGGSETLLVHSKQEITKE